MYIKIIFLTLTNGAYSDEMQLFVAFPLGLHFLLKYSFRSERLNETGRTSRKIQSGKTELNALCWLIRYKQSRALLSSVDLGYT